MTSSLVKLAGMDRQFLILLTSIAPGASIGPEWAQIVSPFRLKFTLAPPLWRVVEAPKTPKKWPTVPFEDASKSRVPDDTGGVYAILIRPAIKIPPHGDYLIYVGKTVDQSLRDRFTQHLDKLSETNRVQQALRDAIQLWDGHLVFAFSPIADSRKIDSEERNLLTAHLPPCNRRYPAGVQGMYDALRE